MNQKCRSELGRKCGSIFVLGKKEAEPQQKKIEAQKAAKIAVLESRFSGDGKTCGLILHGPWVGICGLAFIFLCFIVLCFMSM